MTKREENASVLYQAFVTLLLLNYADVFNSHTGYICTSKFGIFTFFIIIIFSFKLSTYTFPTFAQHMSDDSLVFADINHAKSIQIGLKLYFLYCEE